MGINKNLLEAINSNDVIKAYAVILTTINGDRQRKSFNIPEFAKYADEEFAKKGQAFFAEDDGETEFTLNKEHWGAELWNTMRIELEYNFSEEKLNHIIEIMKYLREKGLPDFMVKNKSSKSDLNSSEVKRDEENYTESESILWDKNIARDSILGAVIGGAVGLIISKTFTGAILGVGVGVGVAGLSFIIDKKE